MDGFFVFQTKIVQKVCSSTLCSAPQAARQASSSRNRPNTALPLPLGGIAARRSLPDEVRHEAERLLRTSIEYAFTHPEASRTYIKQHAQELDDKVIDAHIALFVNGYSLSLGDEGRRAVEALTGVIP